MFSEYDITEKPLDNMAKTEGETKAEAVTNNKETNNNTEDFSKKENNKIENGNQTENTKDWNIKNYINSKTSEYRWFFDTFPNARHEDNSQLRTWEKFQEAMASEIGWITEKKIKWFDKNLWDWKNAEVIEKDWQISIKITQKSKDGNNKELSISLNNFRENTWWELTQNNQQKNEPLIIINWDESLLNDLLNSEENKWEDFQVSDKIINRNIALKDNPDLFKKIFDSIDTKIINPSKEEFYGYVDHAKKIIDSEEFPKFLLEQDNRNNIEWDSNSFVEYLLSNMDKPDIAEQDLVACKTLLSLCILLRNSSNSIQDIKETLWYTEEKNIWKEKTIEWWDHLIEFLPINESDLEHFIACKDEVINLAINELSNEKQSIIMSQQDFVIAQTDKNIWDKLKQINKFLYYLNK